MINVCCALQYIAIFLYKILTKELSEMEDIREDNEEEEGGVVKEAKEKNGPTHTKGDAVSNGWVQHNMIQLYLNSVWPSPTIVTKD